MSASRPPKKSESLEVRIPFETKQAFMARCRADGLSASEATRAFIESYIAQTPARSSGRRSSALRLGVGALIAAAVGAAAVPSLARVVQPPSRPAAEFHSLDVNRDGVVDFGEYSRGRAVTAGGAAAGPTAVR